MNWGGVIFRWDENASQIKKRKNIALTRDIIDPIDEIIFHVV